MGEGLFFFEEALPVIVLSTGGAMEHGQGMVGDGVGETGRWVVESVWWWLCGAVVGRMGHGDGVKRLAQYPNRLARMVIVSA